MPYRERIFLHVYHVNVVGRLSDGFAQPVSLLEAAPSPGAVVNTSSLAGATGNWAPQ